MVKLEDILKQMDAIDWNSVPDWQNNSGYADAYLKFLPALLQNAGFMLKGEVLDVACGPVSSGAIHPDTVACDISPVFVKAVRQRGIRGVLADYLRLPFDDKSFDTVISLGPPMRPYRPNQLIPRGGLNPGKLVRRATSELIRVARKKVLITCSPFSKHYAPDEFKCLIEKQSDQFIIYNLS